MNSSLRIFVFSDVHFAGALEKTRGCPELDIISNPFLRLFVRFYRHFIWRRDPFAQNHLLDQFVSEARDADWVIGNGDYSCDTAFVGVSDDASFASAQECLEKLRQPFGDRLKLSFGDHELGKMSLFGGHGGIRLASWERAQTGLKLEPFWKLWIGNYLLLGVTSSLIAFPVFAPESLEGERDAWLRFRDKQFEQVRAALREVTSNQRVLLFCHDPTALPFLWRDEEIRSKLSQIECTVIGHLHSELLLWKSRLLSGMPPIRFLGNSVRRMSTALHEARLWRDFRVKLCPALSGIELLKDGGYYILTIDPQAKKPLRFDFRPLKSKP
jgi:hypothetical protein